MNLFIQHKTQDEQPKESNWYQQTEDYSTILQTKKVGVTETIGSQQNILGCGTRKQK